MKRTLSMGNRARQHFPDEVRGLALMGILWVNVPYLAISAQGFDRAINGSVLDQAIEFLVAAMFQTKFYLLFSFLFGYSAHLILSRSSSLTLPSKCESHSRVTCSLFSAVPRASVARIASG